MMMVEVHWPGGRLEQLPADGVNDAVAVARGAVACGSYMANVLIEGVIRIKVDCTGTEYIAV
jgi:uncharacterized protein (DUF169 family)